ncbi:ATP-binding cassette domain-containing protein [Endozoicomonas sp. Mp262]|uniref:ATP-binding cassette domain-containing protein n=1 Tax=Endozoicomonas sp. Mp262 TaxID=2919499 RepID=UPI0021D8D579
MGALLELQGVNKWFSGVHALRNINFRLNKGEVVAILGDNGAGKSTLIKVISGLHRPESGKLRVRGKPVSWQQYDVNRARALGVETVYQERSLAEKQPVWRNLFVGRHLRNRFGFIDMAKEKRITARLLKQIGLRGVGISPDSPVSVLSGGERQGLAIGRAMHFDADIIILDEPTNALSLGETSKVLSFIRQIRDSGRSCILICHTMAHVYEVADRYVFVDRGEVCYECNADEVTLESLGQQLIAIARGEYTHKERTQ